MYSGSLADISGIRIGHASDPVARTGATAVLIDDGSVCGVDVRGGAPGTRETDLLHPGESVQQANAILLCGGSAFGLDACTGAMKLLERQGLGVDVGVANVPIVCGAVIFDLTDGRADIRPDPDMGILAAVCAGNDARQGRIGAGTGATVGKLDPASMPAPSGIGSACIELPGGAKVAALMVVNAAGDIYDPYSGKFIAGAHKHDGTPAPVLDTLLFTGSPANLSGRNTTIGVVATDARLTKEQAYRLAKVAQDGFPRAIRPVHTQLDGDTLFAVATNRAECDFNLLCGYATEAVARAIANAGEAANA